MILPVGHLGTALGGSLDSLIGFVSWQATKKRRKGNLERPTTWKSVLDGKKTNGVGERANRRGVLYDRHEAVSNTMRQETRTPGVKETRKR